jgi:hypothetical protein
MASDEPACLIFKPISEAFLFAAIVATRAAATKIPGAKYQLAKELRSVILTARIATTVTNMVSVSRDMLRLFVLRADNRTEPTVGGQCAKFV